MPDAVTVACTSAAAAAAWACGLPTDGALIAAALGAGISTWLQHGKATDLSFRVAVTICVYALLAAGTGLIAGAWWIALVPPWISSGSAPAWAAGAGLVPIWTVIGAASGLSHVLLPLAGRVLRRFVGGKTTEGDGR